MRLSSYGSRGAPPPLNMGMSDVPIFAPYLSIFPYSMLICYPLFSRSLDRGNIPRKSLNPAKCVLVQSDRNTLRLNIVLRRTEFARTAVLHGLDRVLRLHNAKDCSKIIIISFPTSKLGSSSYVTICFSIKYWTQDFYCNWNSFVSGRIVSRCRPRNSSHTSPF